MSTFIAWVIVFAIQIVAIAAVSLVLEVLFRFVGLEIPEGVSLLVALIASFPIAGFGSHWLLDRINLYLSPNRHLSLESKPILPENLVIVDGEV